LQFATIDHPHPPYKGKAIKGKGEDLDPSQQIGLRWEDMRKMGQDITCNAAWKTKGQGKVAILKQGRKKILLTTQIF
jgi:hypothetical protein